MRKALRISAIVVTGLLLLVTIIMLWLTTNSGKNFLRLRIISYMEKRLHTDVQIGKLDYKLPERVELFDVYFGDQRKDTLLSARHMRVNIDMVRLLTNQVQIEEIQIDNAVSHLYRKVPDTAFNFDYVVKAFVAPPNPQAQDAPTDSTGRIQLDIRRLILNKVYVSYDDYTGGDRFAIGIDTLQTTVNKVDPYNHDYRIDALYINGMKSSFNMDTSYLVKKPKKGGLLPNVTFREINLKNIIFNFKNNNDQIAFDLNIGLLFTHPEMVNLRTQDIMVNDLRLDSSNIVLQMGRKAAARAEKLVKTNPVQSKKWRFIAKTVKMNGIDYKMDNAAMQPLSYGLDYAHLNLHNIVVDAQDLRYTTDTISANVRHLAAADKSGLDVKDLRTVFMYHPEGMYFRNLYLQTSRSILHDYAAVSFPSIKALKERPQLAKVQANLENSTLGVQDVLLFAPQLRKLPFFNKYQNEIVKITLVGDGQVSALNIKRFQLQGFDNSYVDVSGIVTGAPDPRSIRYSFNIRQLQSKESVAAPWVPRATLKTMDLPSAFSVNGKISGTVSSANMDLIATTTDGNVTVKGPVAFGRRGRETYDLYVKADRLNIGKIIMQPKTVGKVTGTFYARGQGFDINYMNAVVRGDVASATVLGYTYRNAHVNATIDRKTADIDINSKDPNANLSFKGSIDFGKKYPAIYGKLVSVNLDLQKLGFTPNPLRIAGTFEADISSLNPDYPVGSVYADKPVVWVNGERFQLDSVYVSSTPSDDSGNYIVINTGDIQAIISGHTPLTQIGNIVQSHINRHYAISAIDSVRAIRSAPAHYDLAVNAFVKDGAMIRALVPGLQSMDTARLVAGLTPNTIFLDASAPRVQYNNMTILNTQANVKGDNAGLNYSVTVDRFTGGGMDFWYASATGTVANKEITSKISIADQEKRERFGTSFVFHQHPDKQEIHIRDGLVLNYKHWDVTQPNAIVFSPTGFYVQNFRISNGPESISLNSAAADYSAPLNVAINNFLMSNITEIVSKDTAIANGLINGTLTLRDWKTAPKLNGNVQVANLSVMGDTIGDVDAQLNSATINKVDARIAINGRGNDVIVTGFYYPQAVNGNNFDLNMKINTINVQTIEGLAQYQIKNSVGNVRGDLHITGTLSRPIVRGDLYTDSLSTTIALVGARYMMPNEHIIFTPTGIEFENFRLIDESGNAALVEGKVFTQDMSNLGLAMRLQANRFWLLNTTAKDNEYFYGKLLVSTNLKASGNIWAPDITGTVTVHDSTKMTVVVPEKEVTFQEREGIVEFVDMHDTGMHILPTPHDTVKRLAFRSGAYMNVNLAVEKNAEFTVIVDQGTGDFLRMRGEANLNTVLNPDRTVGVTGVYTINEGAYELNYSFIKRRFTIQPGSTVTFAGDPFEAQLDLKAIYTANVPPYELVEKQVTDPAQLVYYNTRLPFQIELNLRGQAMKPEIGFDIVLPDNRSYGLSGDVTGLVQAKLALLRNSPSDMNKQVFAVLLLNRFVSDNPFESGTGIDPGFVARQSVTRLISEQLNQFVGELIQGIDLTLDLQATEDYTTGARRSRTDLNVAASKRLLNDRLTITVGNNFELEGQNSNRNQNSAIIPGNIAADYELSRTGRYKVRLYRKTENDDIIRGYVSSTGASFILAADYNRLRNLFISRRKQLRRMEEREKARQEQVPPNPPVRSTARK
ncbi:translocation/assembly module TamB domain-containing protein [Polluticoccus soli]|uniref:translocation/assembly module TamB domain-containing protein n=1 Tax=Polluticoccus soli TaxID=3034150 RepID=UPI0023E32171|nr:translocation/assembly module TamB domain-containing protein [Flavipsychrobacter sp. JY13-12]